MVSVEKSKKITESDIVFLCNFFIFVDNESFREIMALILVVEEREMFLFVLIINNRYYEKKNSQEVFYFVARVRWYFYGI